MMRAGACALLALAVALTSSTASAFCRTRTCDLGDPAQDCQIVDGCMMNGLPLFWPSACVSFGVQKDGSALQAISYEQANQVAIDSFLQWRNAACPEGGNPTIDVADFGKISCHHPEYNQEAPNANVIMFRDDWPYTEEDLVQGDTLALTTVTFNVETGEIYDADIEVNSQGTDSLVANSAQVGADDIDLHSVLTHEIGHFLGLSHSRAPGATMLPSLAPGQTSLATIEADDIRGVCEIYPQDRMATTTSCVPRHGFSTACAMEDTGCCTIAPGARSSRTEPLALMLTALGLGLLGARRRRFG